MPIFSLCQTKGGVGKSTLAQCLSYSRTFAGAFESVCLVELNSQGTLDAWRAYRREGPPDPVHFAQVIDTAPATVRDKLSRLAGAHDCLILDVPGESTAGFATKLAVAASDVVLVPMRVSPHDERAFEGQTYYPYSKAMALWPLCRFSCMPRQAKPGSWNTSRISYRKG